jgi:succinate dehydrogenase / fumarate reductase cytochrome b subunit
MANNNIKRPVFLNLFRIHLPVTAVLSLAHRGTGVILFLLIPGLIYLLGLSLEGPQGYEQVLSLVQHPVGRSIFILITWFLAHHLFAGIRYLLLDIDIGIDAAHSRRSAWLVIVAGVGVMLMTSVVVL